MLEMMRLMKLQAEELVELRRERDAGRNERQSTNVSESATRYKEPKANDPEPFNGKHPERLQRWIMQCELVFRLQPERYSSDQIMVTYMISYLRGFAMDGVRPLVEMSETPWELETKENFVEYLKANYGDPDEKGTARRRLNELDQTGSAAEYFSHLRELFAILGWTDQGPIVARAIEGLSSDLKDEVARHGGDFNRLEDLARYITPLDNRLRARRVEREKELKEAAKSKAKSEGATGGSPSQMSGNVQPGSFGQGFQNQSFRPQGFQTRQGSSGFFNTPLRGPGLPEAERQRRRMVGACYRCGQQGHILAMCPLNGGGERTGQNQFRPPQSSFPGQNSSNPKA